jgi:hypothetical protein
MMKRSIFLFLVSVAGLTEAGYRDEHQNHVGEHFRTSYVNHGLDGYFHRRHPVIPEPKSTPKVPKKPQEEPKKSEKRSS